MADANPFPSTHLALATLHPTEITVQRLQQISKRTEAVATVKATRIFEVMRKRMTANFGPIGPDPTAQQNMQQ